MSTKSKNAEKTEKECRKRFNISDEMSVTQINEELHKRRQGATSYLSRGLITQEEYDDRMAWINAAQQKLVDAKIPSSQLMPDGRPPNEILGISQTTDIYQIRSATRKQLDELNTAALEGKIPDAIYDKRHNDITQAYEKMAGEKFDTETVFTKYKDLGNGTYVRIAGKGLALNPDTVANSKTQSWNDDALPQEYQTQTQNKQALIKRTQTFLQSLVSLTGMNADSFSELGNTLKSAMGNINAILGKILSNLSDLLRNVSSQDKQKVVGEAKSLTREWSELNTGDGKWSRPETKEPSKEPILSSSPQNMPTSSSNEQPQQSPADDSMPSMRR